MIVCNRCGDVIPEVELDELEEEQKDEAPVKKGYKKDAPKENIPIRRPSLIKLPYKYGVNCYERKNFDLCEGCQKLLNKQLDKVRFAFIQPESEDKL